MDHLKQRSFSAILGLATIFLALGFGAGSDPASGNAAAQQPSREPWQQRGMDYGPALAYSVWIDDKTLVQRGLNILLDEKTQTAVCFDTETMALAAAWTGGFIDLRKTNLDTYKGDAMAGRPGRLIFENPLGPGWADSQGSFKDARLRVKPSLPPLGNLPKNQAHFKGYFLHGRRVVLKYSILGAPVLEMPATIASEGGPMIVRHLAIGPADHPMELSIGRVPGQGDGQAAAGAFEEFEVVDPKERRFERPVNAPPRDAKTEGSALLVSAENAPAKSRWRHYADGRLTLYMPPGKATRKLAVTIRRGAAGDAAGERPPIGAAVDLDQLTRGGPGRWANELITTGKTSVDQAAYVVDSLTVPFDNPFKAWMRLSAIDFLPDGRAAVATWNGDVWLVGGIDRDLKRITWKRFATGLFEPLGLAVKDGRIYVLGNDRITLLHDLNGDSEADYYENFHAAGVLNPRDAAYDLQTDSKGRFYFVRSGGRDGAEIPLHGCMFRVEADGASSQVIATGLRHADGIAIGPDDSIYCTDQEGNWTPACRLNLIQPGGFHGYAPHSHQARAPKDFVQPLCWIPKPADNSSAGPIWAPAADAMGQSPFGPLAGRMLHLSYGKAGLFLTLPDEARPRVQAGLVRMPMRFESGIRRGKFSPVDGQFYVVGLRGWQTDGVMDGCLQRVRHAGGELAMAVSMTAGKQGPRITFGTKLDRESAENAGNYAIEAWNYRRTEAYGSKDYSPSQPDRVGRDVWKVESARLLEDGRSVELKVAGWRPVMQVRIRLGLKSVSGAKIRDEIMGTIHRIEDE